MGKEQQECGEHENGAGGDCLCVVGGGRFWLGWSFASDKRDSSWLGTRASTPNHPR
jgi:hypothetical protein